MPKDNIFSVKKIHTNTPDTEEVNESLDSIYREDGGDQMNISKLERSGGRGIFFYINWIIVISVAVIALQFTYKFIQERFFAPEVGDFTIAFDAPTSAASGEEIQFDVTYTNGLAVRAHEAELTLQVPDTFIVSNAEPMSSDEDYRLWKISSINSGKTERITVTGTLFGEIGSNHIFQAFISYEPQNFSSRFEEQTSAVIQIASGNLITKKSFPAQGVAGEKFEYEVEILASEEFDAERMVRVVPQFPETFILADEGNTPYAENAEYWEVAGLLTEEAAAANPDRSVKIKFSGMFDGTTNREESITLDYMVEAEEDVFLLEKRDTFTTKLIDGEFILSLILNGEAEEVSVNAGDTLLYTLTYKNQSESEAHDVVLSLPFPDGLLDYTSLTSDPEGAIDGNTLSWTKDEISQLEALPSGEGGSIDISILLKDTLPQGATAVFTNQALAAISGFGELETQLSVKSNEITSPINSDLNWYSSARYYNDEDIPIGTGPMPPQVGNKTTLHIIWRLDSSTHTIEAVNVVGKLPSIVQWTGKTNVDSGSLQYNDTSRTVTWQIDKLPKGGGVIEADFEISITPTFDDLNKIILLMPAAKLTGLDKDTNGQISRTGKALTTDLEDDPVLSGRGLVESE